MGGAKDLASSPTAYLAPVPNAKPSVEGLQGPDAVPPALVGMEVSSLEIRYVGA